MSTEYYNDEAVTWLDWNWPSTEHYTTLDNKYLIGSVTPTVPNEWAPGGPIYNTYRPIKKIVLPGMANRLWSRSDPYPCEEEELCDIEELL